VSTGATWGPVAPATTTPAPVTAAASGGSAAHGTVAHASTVAHATVAHAVSTAASVSVAGLLFQMVIGLGVVLGVIALVARLVKGKGRVGVAFGRRQALVNVVGRQSLGKGLQVAVVRVGERTFLLGVTPNSISQLAELAPHEIEETAPVDPGSPLASAPFWSTRNDKALQFTGQKSPTWMSTIEHLRDLTARR